jgi:hypothetical protein
MRINNLKLFFNTERELLEHASGDFLSQWPIPAILLTETEFYPNGSELTVSCFRGWIGVR